MTYVGTQTKDSDHLMKEMRGKRTTPKIVSGVKSIRPTATKQKTKGLPKKRITKA